MGGSVVLRAVPATLKVAKAVRAAHVDEIYELIQRDSSIPVVVCLPACTHILVRNISRLAATGNTYRAAL